MPVVKEVFDPGGRGLRREYWLVGLVGWVVLFAPVLADWAFELSEEQRVGWAIGGFGLLAYQIVAVLAAIRRLHDTDHSGWWLLIALVPVVGSAVLSGG
ncbi:DUF805 domain-containing protein [Kribbella sp. NPDC005582]|uniref:DUF805 domain-containing protein n=1 Tax=Kribbella sp. NPDC005582 TaxID=3156893 RepID=UPI0033B92473